MVIFHSYVSLPEGTLVDVQPYQLTNQRIHPKMTNNVISTAVTNQPYVDVLY